MNIKAEVALLTPIGVTLTVPSFLVLLSTTVVNYWFDVAKKSLFVKIWGH